MPLEFETKLQTFFKLDDHQLSIVSSFFKPLSLKKNKIILETNQYCDQIIFIKSGIIREYLYTPDGKDVTKWIATPGYFILDLGSFIFNYTARCNLQTLTECELFVLHKSDYHQLQEVIPDWHQIEKLFIAKCFIVLEERVITHLSMNAEERYNWLFRNMPELYNLVPLQYLASMLGMTPETLSRIRKKQMAG